MGEEPAYAFKPRASAKRARRGRGFFFPMLSMMDTTLPDRSP